MTILLESLALIVFFAVSALWFVYLGFMMAVRNYTMYRLGFLLNDRLWKEIDDAARSHSISTR